MQKTKLNIYDHPYVFVVMEHSFGALDAKLHGVYTTKQIAEAKKASLQSKGLAKGYVSVLKKHVDGPVSKDYTYIFNGSKVVVLHKQ